MRKQPTVFSGIIKVVVLSIALEWLGWGLTDVFYSIFVNEIVRNDYFLTGLFLSFYQFLVIFTVLFWGDLADLIGPFRLFSWSRWIYFLVGPLYFLAGFLHSPLVLIITFLINSIGKGMRDVSERAFLMEHSNSKNCSRILGTDSAVKNTLWILGILLGAGVMYFLGSYFSEFSIITVMYAALSIFVLPGIILTLRQRKNFEPFPKNLLPRIKKLLWKEKIITPLWKDFKKFSLPLQFSLVMFGFLQILSDVVLIFVPLLTLELGLEYYEIGILIAFVYIPFLFIFLFSRLADQYDRTALLKKGFAFAIFPLLCIALTQNVWYIGFFSALVAFSCAILEPALLGFSATLAPHHKQGEVASLQFFFNRSGSMVGMFCIGLISEYFGIQITFLLLSILTLGVFLSAIWLENYLLRNQGHQVLSTKHLTHHHVLAHVHCHHARRH